MVFCSNQVLDLINPKTRHPPKVGVLVNWAFIKLIDVSMEGKTKKDKDPSKITSDPMTRKKATELTNAPQTFVSSFFMEHGLGFSQWAAGTFKTSCGNDGQAWHLILKYLDKFKDEEL